MAVASGVPQICIGLRSGGMHSPQLQSHDLLAAAPRCNHRHDVRVSYSLQYSHGFSDTWEIRMHFSPLLVETRYDLAEPVGTIATLLLLDGRLPTLLVSPDSQVFMRKPISRVWAGLTCANLDCMALGPKDVACILGIGGGLVLVSYEEVRSKEAAAAATATTKDD